jgi:hypothetical protein
MVMKRARLQLLIHMLMSFHMFQVLPTQSSLAYVLGTACLQLSSIAITALLPMGAPEVSMPYLLKSCTVFTKAMMRFECPAYDNVCFVSAALHKLFKTEAVLQQ